MRDSDKTKNQLIDELAQLRQRMKELEAADAEMRRELDERLRGMLESLHEGLLIIDLEGKIVEVNDALLGMGGFSQREELIGRSGLDFIAEGDRAHATEAMSKAFEHGYTSTTEYRLMAKDGSEYNAEASAAVLYDSSGKPQGLICIVRDITERTGAANRLKESEEKYRALVDQMEDGYMVIREGKVLFANKKCSGILGISMERLIGGDYWPLISPVDIARAEQVYETLMSGEDVPYLMEFTTAGVDGEQGVPLEVSIARVTYEGQLSYGVVFRDITGRRRVERELREWQELSRGMLESAAAGIWLTQDGEFRYASPQFEDMTGYRSSELLSTASLQYIHPDDREATKKSAIENLKGKSDQPHEFRFIRKDGRSIWILERMASIEYRGRRAAIGSFMDITERRRAEEELRQSEERMRTLFDSSPDFIIEVDRNGIILFINRTVPEFTVEDTIGKSCYDFILPEFHEVYREAIEQAFQTGERITIEVTGTGPDSRTSYYEGRFAPIKHAGKVTSVMLTATDITERRRAEEELKTSEEKLRTMFESIGEGVVVVDLMGRVLDLNETQLRATGYSREEVLGRSGLDFILEKDRDRALKDMAEALETGQGPAKVYTFVGKDGKKFEGETGAALLRDGYGNPVGFISVIRDITERRLVEKELKRGKAELEQRTNQLLALQKITASIQGTLELKEVLQQAAEAVVDNLGYDHSLMFMRGDKGDVSRGTVFFSKGGSKLVGKVERAMARTLTDIEIPLGRGYGPFIDNMLSGKVVMTHDLYDISQHVLTREQCSGVQKLLGAKSIVYMPLFARSRQQGSILVFTGRKRITEVDLEPLRLLADQAGVAIENANLYQGASEMAQRLAVTGVLSRIVGSSIDIREVYQTFTDEIKKIIDFDRASIGIAEGDKLRFFAVSSEVETGLGDGVEFPLADSATSWVIENKRTNIDPDFAHKMQFPIDEVHLRSGLRSAIRVPLFSKGEVFGTFNLTSRKINAYGEREREILEQLAGSIAAATENSRLFIRVREHEAELERAYEELKAAQDYMVQAERLRALGEMAGGVAHDFNNILAVVLGRAQLALEDVKDAKLEKDLHIIEQTAIDAAATVRRLQDFSRVRVDRAFEPLDLNKMVEGALQMVESRRLELKETAAIAIEIKSEPGKVSSVAGDAAELREALVNILFNAMDSMPEGGSITVRSRQKGNTVILSVGDTGVGIHEDIRSRIFDPFFTTRAPEGSGLGLSVTYGIITRHGGTIEVESEEGEGATFNIGLPAVSGVEKKAHVERKAPVIERASILLVDDDPDVIEVLGLTLEHLGHWVLPVSTGAEALDAFKEGSYDLVITDMGMPDMSGRDIAKAVKEISPRTPVLLITGWGVQLDKDKLPGVDGVIAKPFSKDTLLDSLADVLLARASDR